MWERRRASVWAFHSHFIHEHRMTSSSWPARRQQIVHSQNPKAARQLFCSVLSQLGLVALSSQPSSTPCGDFFLAVTDTGIPLTDCNTISAWLFCFTDVKAPDASKYVLLRQIRQSSVCLWAWFLKCVSSQRQKYRGKKQMEACHITERAVWFPTFLVRQKSEMSRRSCKLLLWFDKAKNSKTETLAWKL